MESITTFFSNLSLLNTVYVSFIIIGGTLFIIRMILLILGGVGDFVGDVVGDIADGDAAGDFDHAADLGDAGLNLFTMHGITSFITMFGLVGLMINLSMESGELLSIIGGTLAGFFMMLIMAKMIQVLMQFQSSGNIDIHSAIGKEAEVYARILPQGTGQVQVVINESLRMYNSISDDPEEIKTGTRVKVVEVAGTSTLKVERV